MSPKESNMINHKPYKTEQEIITAGRDLQRLEKDIGSVLTGEEKI